MKNPKQKLKNVLLLFASLVLVSCSEDLYDHEIQKNDSGYKIMDKSFEELRKDKKFMKAYAEINSSGNSTSKTVMEQNYNFTISDIPAKVIEKNGKASYTFHIVRDTVNHDYFENLIVGSDSINQTTAYIAKYKKDLTKPSLINNVPFTKINVNSIVYNNNPTGKVTECITKVYSLCNGIPYDCGGSYCGFASFTLCSGSSGSSNNGSGISWGGGGISTTPIGGGSSSNMENFYSNLKFQQQQWLDEQTSETQQSILNYLNTNGFTTANKNKIKQLINYLMLNPNVSYEQYVNWFMTQSEGKDFSYDQTYWENPSLNFPSQNLPTYNSFYNAYPKNPNGSWMEGANTVYAYVGGEVQQTRIDYPNDTNNTCALKVSIALNGSGIVIPNIPGQTLQGGGAFAGKFFFLNARALNKWMRKTFGTITNPNYMNIPASQITPNGANLPLLLSNIKGIYSLVCPLGSPWASGHADIINNSMCAAGCHFPDAPIEYIDVWKLN